MLRSFVLLLCAYGSVGYGYDSGGDQASCGRPYRSGRVYQPPCDLHHGYCTSAGSAYPWQAVRRFVRDNQGLMKRMYGDQRHGRVLREELKEDLDFQEPHFSSRFPRYQHEEIDNELFLPEEDFQLNEPRYLKDDTGNDDLIHTKFVYSQEPTLSIKLVGLKTPHFRPTQKSTTSSTTTATTARTETTKPSTEPSTPESTEATTETTLTTNAATTIATNLTEASTKLFKEETKKTNFTEETKKENEEKNDKIADDRVGLEGEEIFITTARTDVTSESEEIEVAENEKVEAVLFQDMEEDPTKKKMHVNNKMRGVNACPVKEEVVAPFWANNTRGEVLALLNMYPFEQYVHWEKCSFEHRQMYCREGCRCEQQYRLHRLLAYDPNNECRGIFSDWFRFPSCCICKCYDMPSEFRITSRSPRFMPSFPED